MNKEYIASAETVEEATALALEELGVNKEDANVVVLEEPGKKLFGGRKDAVVKASLVEKNEEDPDNKAKENVSKVNLETTDPSESFLSTDEVLEKTKRAEVIEVFDIDELTDEQVDEIADIGIEHLKKLISFLSTSEVSIEEFEGDEGEIILDVTGEDAGLLIGRHGRTIDALQSIVSAMTTRKMGIRYPLSVDVEGYKHRRKQKVVDIAKRAADRARNTNRSVSLKPMTPYERRIVHMTIRNQDGVTSTSEGSGSYRHIVIVPL